MRETNVSEGDLAEFTCGPNKGKRCIIERMCGGSDEVQEWGIIWHIYPIHTMTATRGYNGWPDGVVLMLSATDHPHAKDRDLRKVPPEELEEPPKQKVEVPA